MNKTKFVDVIQYKINETPDFCRKCNSEIRLPIYYWITKWGFFIIGLIIGLYIGVSI